MKKIIFSIALSVLFFSCKQKEEKKEIEAPQTPQAAEVPASAIQAASAGNLTSSPTTYSVAEPVASAAANGSYINPAHGQPGHSCDYAVGALIPSDAALALNTEPARDPNRKVPVAPSATSTLNMQLNTTVPTGPKPQFNPPHGQPWHTCDLEVGAPLN